MLDGGHGQNFLNSNELNKLIITSVSVLCANIEDQFEGSVCRIIILSSRV